MGNCEFQSKKKPIWGVTHIFIIFFPKALTVLESSDICHHPNHLYGATGLIYQPGHLATPQQLSTCLFSQKRAQFLQQFWLCSCFSWAASTVWLQFWRCTLSTIQKTTCSQGGSEKRTVWYYIFLSQLYLGTAGERVNAQCQRELWKIN